MGGWNDSGQKKKKREKGSFFHKKDGFTNTSRIARKRSREGEMGSFSTKKKKKEVQEHPPRFIHTPPCRSQTLESTPPACGSPSREGGGCGKKGEGSQSLGSQPHAREKKDPGVPVCQEYTVTRAFLKSSAGASSTVESSPSCNGGAHGSCISYLSCGGRRGDTEKPKLEFEGTRREEEGSNAETSQASSLTKNFLASRPAIRADCRPISSISTDFAHASL